MKLVMSATSQRPFGRLLTVSVLALLVAGCGGATQSASRGSGASEEPGGSSGGATGEITEHVFSVANSNQINTIDPRSAFGTEYRFLQQVYQSLTRIDPNQEETVQPSLALSWTSNEDATEWTFELRPDVTFHDGSPFNAEAVKASVESIQNLGEGPAYIWDAVTDIEAVDDLTVRFTLDRPAPLDLIAGGVWGSFVTCPDASAQPTEWFDEGNDCGTGAYEITDYTPGTRVVLHRYDDYWGGWEEGQYTDIVFDLNEDPASRLQLLTTGEVQTAIDLPFTAFDSLDSNPDTQAFIYESDTVLWLMLNSATPPLDDVRVRQALVLSFPYDEVRELLLDGHGFPLNGYIPGWMFGLSDFGAQEQDMDQARALLAEAGYPDGGFTVDYLYRSTLEVYEQIAPVWQDAVDELGITITPQGVETARFGELTAKPGPLVSAPDGTYGAISTRWAPSYPSPLDFYYSMISSQGEYNYSNISDEELDQGIAQGEVNSAAEDKSGSFDDAQARALELAPIIPIIGYPTLYGYTSDVVIPDVPNDPFYWVDIYSLRAGG